MVLFAIFKERLNADSNEFQPLNFKLNAILEQCGTVIRFSNHKRLLEYEINRTPNSKTKQNEKKRKKET